ncbi:glycosyltransferase family 4 protein [Gryllotalpicola protaetiae]|uniref:Glycosyltransferase n=1 Tax=Gryllotalpicola protaetiae TaxID=2419771 RepID=A0A387BEI7_9MICO|nr:glycosyltransferase family 4 protein [Gryllotalpicola protaetiae]AYG02313.1 glycosyltransferase [Gryllotalpicola protaetiae]
MTRVVWFLVPAGIDDPERVSGGNVYDRRLRDGLAQRGWDVRMLEAAAAADVPAALAAVPRGAVALVDGLVAGWAPDAIGAAAAIRLIVLAHMVLGAFADADGAALDAERRALAAAGRVIATSAWTAGELVRRGLVDEERVSVALPGASGAPQGHAPGSEHRLLCVGVVAPHKGQDVLLEALSRLRAREWTCTLAGSLAVAPDFAAGVARAAARFEGRVRTPGVLRSAELERAYRGAGLVVAPSRAESFGMALADARSRGIPVIASAAGGIGEAVAGGGALLVPPDDPEALAHALWRWLANPRLRARLRAEAVVATHRAPRWADTVADVDRVLGAA